MSRSFDTKWFVALTLLALSCGNLWTQGPDGGVASVEPLPDGGDPPHSADGGQDAGVDDGQDAGVDGGHHPGVDGGTQVVQMSCTTASATVEVRVADPQLKLSGVRSMVFDSTGQLFVLDRALNTSNGRVQVFSPAPDHRWLRTIGEGVVETARDMALDSRGRLHVLSKRLSAGEVSTVRIFEADGGLVGSWTPPDKSGNGIASDGQGHLYVSEYGLDAYSEEGVFERQVVPETNFPDGPLPYPWGMAAAPPVIWVADMVKRAVVEIALADGSVRSGIGRKGTGPGEFDGDAPADVVYGPNRVVLDRAGHLYANDPYQSRIQKFSTQGAFLGAFTFAGQSVGGLAVEPQSGNVYVGRGSAIAIVCPL